jgi:hypothetical protein
MAKLLVRDECIDIRVGLLERMMLAERSRRLPLSSVRKVDPHPPLLDMMLHWAERGSPWMCGVSRYEGHMIPSGCKPRSTLAIELCDEPQIFVELDDEEPEQAAERISRALGSEPPPPSPAGEAASAAERLRALDVARIQRLAEEDERDFDQPDEHAATEGERRGDDGRWGAPPPPSEPAAPLALDDDHDLARLGGWLLALGSLCVLTGVVMTVAGALPGLLAVGAGIACSALGGIALAVVAHHQA